MGPVGGRRSDLGEPVGRWRVLRNEEVSAVQNLTMTGRDRERPWTRSPATHDVEQTHVMARLENEALLRRTDCAGPRLVWHAKQSHTTRGSSGLPRRRLGIERWLRTQLEELGKGSPPRPRGPLWGSRAESELGVLVDN